MRTKTLIVQAASAVALSCFALAACGSGSASSHETNEGVRIPTFSSSAPSIVSEPNQGAPTNDASAPSLHLSGTFTESANDTTFSQTWRVGEPEAADSSGQAPSDVPSDVLDACNVNYSATLATIAFVPGSVELKYSEGTLPQIIGFVNDQLILPSHALVAFDSADGWDCGDASGGAATSLTLQAGEDTMMDIWILLPVLDNSNPELTPSVQNSLRFVASGLSLPFGGNVVASGPGALCLPGDSLTEIGLFLYADSGGKISCA